MDEEHTQHVCIKVHRTIYVGAKNANMMNATVVLCVRSYTQHSLGTPVTALAELKSHRFEYCQDGYGPSLESETTCTSPQMHTPFSPQEE